MLLPALDTSPGGTSSLASVSDATMGREDFLLLLVTQLSNQDPLNPMDGQEFAAQLAQFSSLEQLINLNDGMTAAAELNGLLAQSINSGVAAGLIGKQIEAIGNEFRFDGQTAQTVHFELDRAAGAVTVEVFDEAGRKVRTLDGGALGKGEQHLNWDGTGDDGAALPAGTYTFEVRATDGAGATVAVTPLMRGTVDRVTFSQGGILLWIGDESVAMGNVRSVLG